MTGTLSVIANVTAAFQDGTVVVETSTPVSQEDLDRITAVSTQHIPRGVDGAPATQRDSWAIIDMDRFAETGGYLKRSPDGNLSVMFPLGSPLLQAQPGSFLFSSTDEVEVE